MRMERILGLTLEDFSLQTLPTPRYDASEQEIAEAKAKAIRFGESVIGRELLNYLPMHSCDRGCDSIELSVAEMLAAKRPLNPHALNLFFRRFSYSIRHANEEMLKVMQDNQWTVRDYVENWLNEFMLKGIQVLHGEMQPRELFGEGYLLETWTRLEEFLNQTK